MVDIVKKQLKQAVKQTAETLKYYEIALKEKTALYTQAKDALEAYNDKK